MSRGNVSPSSWSSSSSSPSSSNRRKQLPPEQTNAESFYYLKQMQQKTDLVFVLVDGEEIRGIIEWYDKFALKIIRHKAPAILLMKDKVKYLYKYEEIRRYARSKKRKELEEESD